MQEYRDDTYGEIKEATRLLSDMTDDQIKKTRSVHFGTRERLERIKDHGVNARQTKAKLDQLERKINRVIVHLGISMPGEILVVD